MVLGAFPLGKLALFGLKQIIKPVSGIVLIVAKRSTLFRRIVCAPAGQFIHWIEVRSKMHMLKLPQPKRIPILRENAATDLGSKLIGELFVLTVGLYLIRLEISRQALKDKKKHEVHVLQRSELRNKLSTLKNLVKWQDDELNKLRLKLRREGESNDGRHK